MSADLTAPTGSGADPRFRAERARYAGRISNGPKGSLTRLLKSVDGDVESWAERIAASLPPLTRAEAQAVGKLAAALDARSRKDGGGSRAA